MFTKKDVKTVKEKIPEFDKLGISDEEILMGINNELEHKDVTGGDLIKTAKIALAHFKEDKLYYKHIDAMESRYAKQNSKAKVYTCKFLEPGTVKYDDEILYITKETIISNLKDVEGLPVVVEHSDETDSNNIIGYATNPRFDDLIGWAVCELVIFNHERVADEPMVSCAYIPTEQGKGGAWHNQKYDREITKMQFLHISTTQTPRYEQATSIKKNSKESNSSKEKGTNMINLFRTKKTVQSIDANSTVVLKNGKSIKLKTLIERTEAKLNSKKNEVQLDDTFEVAGKKMTVQEMIDELSKKEASMEEEEIEKEEEQIEEEEEEELENEAMTEQERAEEVKEERDKQAKTNKKKNSANPSYFKKLNSAKHQTNLTVEPIPISTYGGRLLKRDEL